VVKAAACAVDWARPPATGLVVLLYHRVGRASGDQIELAPDLFARQMEVVAEQTAVVSLDEAIRRMQDGDDVSGHVALTFDDGTADFVDAALPVLVSHRLPATLFLATEFIDTGRPFPWGASPLSWAGVREAVSTGIVTIGSHTHGHRLLDRVDERTAADDIDRSIDAITSQLATPPRHFAYPKALPPSPACERVVRARFASASLAGTRPSPRGWDAYRLNRSPIQRSDGMRFFLRKLHGGMAAEDTLRRVSHRLRYARAAT
jgi:peptidoglycan/xylan/chitin deacetylase (PgdA/CDA1 family)